MFDIDAVVTFVDGNEPVWRKAFEEELVKQGKFLPTIPESYNLERYQTQNELQLCLNGIVNFMPFVRKIFLVVSNPEQVPDYAKKIGKLEVVLHRDIIPDKFLPTFNCMTIEMFLHRIPGLSEHFIYFNDDMVILRKQKPDRWFDMETGIPNNGFKFSKYKYPMPAYIYAFLNSLKVAADAANHHDYPTCDGKYFTLQHTTKAMLKSTCEELWEKIPDVLEGSCTTFRSEKSLTVYVFQFYDLFTGRCNNVKRKSFKQTVDGTQKLLDFYYNDEICVNMKDERLKKEYLERMARMLKCDKPPR